MTRAALVLRPEPGNAATAARLAAAGVPTIRLPLFAIAPLPWVPPDPARFDALLLTSANAVRTAGPSLQLLRALSAVVVGEATAAAARDAGLTVAAIGSSDAGEARALAQARGWHRLLRLAGQERTPLSDVTDIAVYASAPIDLAPGAMRCAQGAIALLHSPRAARAFAALIDRDGTPRDTVRVIALSQAVADAAGPGWACLDVPAQPTDAALVARAATRAIDP